MRWLTGCGVLLLVVSLGVYAQVREPSEEAQGRAARLAEQLRCLVCQNQSIADSNADLAVDLRRQITEQIGQGRSDAEIVDFMVQRYGDFVLYKPPLKATTLVLWFGPLILLVIGAAILIRHLRERSKLAAPAHLSEEEQRAAARLLGESGADDPR